MGCRKQASLPLLFLNNNDPVFCTLLFATHILDLFLKFQTLKKYQVNLINQNSGCRLTGRGSQNPVHQTQHFKLENVKNQVHIDRGIDNFRLNYWPLFSIEARLHQGATFGHCILDDFTFRKIRLNFTKINFCCIEKWLLALLLKSKTNSILDPHGADVTTGGHNSSSVEPSLPYSTPQ